MSKGLFRLFKKVKQFLIIFKRLLPAQLKQKTKQKQGQEKPESQLVLELVVKKMLSLNITI